MCWRETWGCFHAGGFLYRIILSYKIEIYNKFAAEMLQVTKCHISLPGHHLYSPTLLLLPFRSACSTLKCFCFVEFDIVVTISGRQTRKLMTTLHFNLHWNSASGAPKCNQICFKYLRKSSNMFLLIRSIYPWDSIMTHNWAIYLFRLLPWLNTT